MTEESATRPVAVRDTSFWTLACRAEVAANCLDLFQIMVPRAVEAEIRAADPTSPRREYPYSTLFRHLRGRMLDPPRDVPYPLGLFGAGEAEGISLAQHLGAVLLINERPAAAFASRRGGPVVTVPTVIVTLRRQNVSSDRAARRKLELIELNTAAEIVADARRALDRLAH